MDYIDFYDEKVLVIDDCELFQHATSGMLDSLGFAAENTYLAPSAKQALVLAKKVQFNIILCDFNLGSGANGLQLLEALKAKQLVTPDCLFIITTAESSLNIIRQFVEFQPDDYIIKPINRNTLYTRLPFLTYRKKMLAGPIKAYERGEYQQVLDIIASGQGYEDFILEELGVYEAKSLAKLGQVDEAIELFNSVLSDAKDSPKLLLEYAQFCYEIGRFSLAKSALEVLKTEPLHVGSVFYLLAKAALENDDLKLAEAHIETSVKYSNSNVERLILKCVIALARKEYELACQTIKQALGEAQNSIHRNERLYALALHIFCLMPKFEPEFGSQADRLILQLRKLYQKQIDSSNYKRLDLLTKSHLALLRNQQSRAILHFQMFEKVNATVDKKCSLLEEIILVERATLLFHFNASKLYQHSVSLFDSWRDKAREQRHRCFHIHANTLLKRKAQFQQHKKSSLLEAEKAYCQQNYQEASLLVATIYEMHIQQDFNLCRKLVCYLNKGWPTGWSKSQVSRLALSCRTFIAQSKGKLLTELAPVFASLSKQLQLPELVVTDEIQ